MIKLELTKDQIQKLKNFTGKESIPKYLIFPDDISFEDRIINLDEKKAHIVAGCCGTIIGTGCTAQD